MEAMEYEVGQKVATTVNNVKVHGTVESIQKGKNLVDIKVYQPGHTHHCLIVARPPAEITMAADDHDPVPIDPLEGLTKDDLRQFAEHVDERITSFNDHFLELDRRMTALESRADDLEAAKKSKNHGA